MSHRTQITLSDAEYELLRRESERSGLSLAELVRRAVDSTYGLPSKDERLGAIRASAGAWSEEPGEDRAAYLRELRRGFDARLDAPSR